MRHDYSHGRSFSYETTFIVKDNFTIITVRLKLLKYNCDIVMRPIF